MVTNLGRLLPGVLCVGMMLTGCGESSTTSKSSSNRVATPSGRPPSAAINVMVPGLLPGYILPTRYTCDGEDISPPVRWTSVPDDTAELVVFIANFQPVHDRLFFDWAVAGLGPKTHGLAAGRLPVDAVVGRNSFGRKSYSICPPSGTRYSYAVRVIALPHAIAVHHGFDALTLYREAEQITKAVGFAGVNYTRP